MSFSFGTRDCVTFSFGTGRGAWAWIGLPAQQLRAILRRAGRCLALRWLTRENQSRCAYEQRPSAGEISKNLATDQSWGLCEALEFPSQAELINFEINRFNVSGIQSVKRTNDLMAVPIPLE